MATLTERTAWTKPRPANETRRSSDLTPDEQRHVKAALRFLALRVGSYAKLAAALKANVCTVREACGKRGKPSATVALRAARLAGVAVEDVLSGVWPKAGACPHCGRSG